MKKYWELQPNDVQVEIKDQKHLNELFEMCELFGVEIFIFDYKSGYKYFRKNVTKSCYSNYIFNECYTVVTTEQFYEILSHHYGYKLEIEGFDKDVVLRMLECQEEQGYNRDIKVFEYSCCIGFDWSNTKEGHEFWSETIINNRFKVANKQQIHEKNEDYKILYHDLLEKFNQLKKIIN